MNVIFDTEGEIRNRFGNIEIENATIEYIDLEVIGHFGNVVSSKMPIIYRGNFYTRPLDKISSTLSCGILIRTIFNLLDLGEDNGVTLSSLKNIPCRVINNSDGTIAIGHFMKDKFMIIDDFFNQFKEYINNLEIK